MRCLLLALLLSLAVCSASAQDTEAGNPTGPSGDFNGEVTTAGAYDPFTGNLKRRVTDLSVPGANGGYPLGFARTFNSQTFVAPNDRSVLGDGSNWRHSYQWNLGVTSFNSVNGAVTAYTVAYPDGAVIVFKPGRNFAPANEYANYWRGPSGTPDRLEVVSATEIYLHTNDGGVVAFVGGNPAWPSYLLDPNGAKTTLVYNGTTGYLTQVTEPGGRTLTFHYHTVTQNYRDLNSHQRSWSTVLLDTVTASNGQSATYSYTPYDPNHTVNETADGGPAVGMVNYQVLTDVNYGREDPAGSAAVHAYYSYTYNASAYGPPILVTAQDPHYAGAMKSIRYAGSNVPGGTSFEEENYGSSERVSHLERSVAGNGATASSQETRGDATVNGAAIQRTFSYGPRSGPPIPGENTANPPKASVLTAVADFEGHSTGYSYYGNGDTDYKGNVEPKSFLRCTQDAAGNLTSFIHEPITGKVATTRLPDGRERSAVWAGKDGSDALQPYYLARTTDERGHSTTYHRYSNTGFVYQVDSPIGTEYYQYRGFNGPNGAFYKVSLFQNKLGGQITYAYDEANHGGSGHLGLLTTVTRSYATGPNTVVSESTRFTYDALDRVSQTSDPRGVSDQYTYNGRHQVTRVLHTADNTHVDTVYDDAGRPVSVADELGHATTTSYDEYSRPVSVTTPVNAPNAAGTQIASRYQAFSYLRYDNSNHVLASATSHTSAAWGAAWQPTGSAVQRVFSPNGWCTDEYLGMYVNGGQNPIQPVPGSGYAHRSTAFNALGQPRSTTDAQGFATTYTYDACHRLATTTDPLGGANHTLTRTYYGPGEQASSGSGVDCTGLLKSVTSPGSDLNSYPTVQTRCSNYDLMARLLATVDPSNHTFNSGYDAGGDLISQTDGAHSTGYSSDQLGRKSAVGYPDGSSEAWTYDASGNVATYKNRAGAVCTYSYTDGRNRCTGYTWNDNATSGVSYFYRANGQLKETNNANSDIRFTYDDSDALLAEDELTAQPTRMVTRYTHDADGNVDKITYPNGNPPHFTYDNQERVTGMDAAGSQFSLYFYSGDRLASRYLLNGFYTTYDYQSNGRVWDVWHHNGNGHNVRRQCYGYYPDGRISWVDRESDGTGSDGSVPANSAASGSILENGQGDEFRYYPDGSLYYGARDIAATGGWPGNYGSTADSQVSDANVSYAHQSASTYGFGYVYDAAGNRTQANQMGQSIAYYDSGQHPGENQYSGSGYDANGNTTNSAVGWTYAYDAENKLVGAAGPSGQTLGLAYDALGRLTAQVTNGVAAYFYYAGAQRIEEHDASNQAVYLYFYEAPGSDRLLFRQGGPWWRLWYQTDLLGNTTHLSAEQYNSNGQLTGGSVVEQYLYDPFGTPTVYDAAGRVRPGGSAYDNRRLFKSSGGYQWLAPAGLYHCRARCYLPQHGRFLQPDPSGQAGGLNLYSYCHNDPINQSDPSGLAEDDATGDAPKQSVDPVTPTGTLIPNHYYNIGNNVYQSNAVWGSTFVGAISYGANGDPHAPAGATNANLSGGSLGAVALFWGAGGSPDMSGRRNSNNAIQTMTDNANKEGMDARAYGRDQVNSAVDFLEAASDAGESISVVGYSRGAIAALNTTEQLLNDFYLVDNLVVIDAVLPRGGRLSVPMNVIQAFNFYEKKGGIGAFLSNSLQGHGDIGQLFRGTRIDQIGVNNIQLNVYHGSVPFRITSIVNSILASGQ